MPALQVAFALATFVYAPYQYKAGPHPVHDDFMLLGYRKLWPPPSLRTTYALNFPALTAVVPFRFCGSWSRRNVVRYEGPPYFSLSVEDCMFFAGVFALWHWLGSWLDRRRHGRGRVPRHTSVRVTLLTIVLLLPVGVGILASYYVMLTDADRPFRQIGMAGLLWAVALLWFFVRNLVAALRMSSGNTSLVQ